MINANLFIIIRIISILVFLGLVIYAKYTDNVELGIISSLLMVFSPVIWGAVTLILRNMGDSI